MREAQAGSLESGDLLVLIRESSSPDRIEVSIKSPVKPQFGRQIEAVARQVLGEAGVSGVGLYIEDRGALDYVIRARVSTALARFRRLAGEGSPRE